MHPDNNKNLITGTSQFDKEKTYWLNEFAGELVKSYFHYDFPGVDPTAFSIDRVEFNISPGLSLKLNHLTNGSDKNLFIIFAAVLVVLLSRYTGHHDIVIGTPILKQQLEGKFLNTLLALRNRLNPNINFKELLMQVKNTFTEANANSNYPIRRLLHYLGLPKNENASPLFETLILLQNIHDKKYIENMNHNMVFALDHTQQQIAGVLEYNALLYRKQSIESIVSHFLTCLENGVKDVNQPISQIEILSKTERHQLLVFFNNTRTPYPGDKVLHRLFEEQAQKTPESRAVVYQDAGTDHSRWFTYKQLNENANRLARILRKKGVRKDSIVGLMVGPSPRIIQGILAVWKAGGAYLPLDPGLPGKRLVSMLEDANISFLLTENRALQNYSFTGLQTSQVNKKNIHITDPRPPISNPDHLPLVDRSLVNYEKYMSQIGQASVKHTIALQATRGCPYSCAYCHQLWSKKHIVRSAENLFNEVQCNYNLGIRRFTFIDDVFNLNRKNSRKFFEMIIRSRLDVQLFFSSGLRGDVLTREYIDLMVEAGTKMMAMGLETASPRLQKMIKRNLNIERFRENIQYICEKYPQILLVLQTIMGFPTETKEEATMTLDFIKSLKWLDFPSLNVLKIYPNTQMEKLALENGISKKTILKSSELAYHQLPDTLPFEKEFALHLQTDYLNNYFLSKERLLNVLPYQMKVMSEDELVQRYNNYLPVEIDHFDGLLEFTGINKEKLGAKDFLDESLVTPINFYEKAKTRFPAKTSAADSLKILLLDLSQFFSGTKDMLYDVAEPPLGLMALMTYLNRELGSKIDGKVTKSRFDFDNYEELKALLEKFRPHVIGIRTLTLFRDFFHKTAAMIRQWGFDGPIITGGPYASSDYHHILQDRNIDLVVLGEGELTFHRVIHRIIQNDGKLPAKEILEKIPGIAFVPPPQAPQKRTFRKIIIFDELEKQLEAESGDNLPTVSTPDDLAYVIFTSGSTGKPKGVMITNENLSNYITWFTGKTGFNEKDKTLLTSSFAFDLGYTSIYSAIMTGGQLHILPKEIYLSQENLLNYINAHDISCIKFTPSLFKTIVASIDFTREKLQSLRLIVLGGEAINTDDVEKTHALGHTIRVMNHYGPTEATIGSIARFIDFEHVDDYKKAPTIGQPINNTNVYILNKDLYLLPAGVPGELCISGAGLARGYMNRPELTAEKFVLAHGSWLIADRVGKESTAVFPMSYQLSAISYIYRTGDLARWQPNGEIEFLGRIDFQVKIRGFRIEQGEIENRLLSHKLVKEAVVIIREESDNDKYLCGYIVPHQVNEFQETELRDYLSAELPDYMVPTYLVPLEKIPLNPNGKVDRNALPEPETTGNKNYVPPKNEIEKKLVEIWSQVLDKQNIGTHDNFFELGGHSLKATVLTARIKRELDVILPLIEIFNRPKIHLLAQYINTQTKENKLPKDHYLLLLKEEKNSPHHLFFTHDGTGEVDAYIELCKSLEPGYNCWGITADPFEHYAPKNLNIENMAAKYIERITMTQPPGPYSIVGWSFGGLIAFEMVRLLEQKKQHMNFLAMIDTPPPNTDGSEPIAEFTLKSELDWIKDYLPGDIYEKIQQVSRASQQFQLEHMWELILHHLESGSIHIEKIKEVLMKLGGRGIPNIANLDIAACIRYLNILRSSIKARLSYAPGGKIDTPVHYFWPAESKITGPENWNDYTSQPIKIYKIPGDHYSILKLPHLANLGKQLAIIRSNPYDL
ncbi:MAG: amino acid adenylation domain-containing protein [Candidatus Aminicenantes bacterium]|jgi:amino acid adenylation domain-containing protein